MKNFRVIFIAFVVILVVMGLTVYGSRKVIASEGHKHEDVHDDREKDGHEGRDHETKKEDNAGHKQEENGHEGHGHDAGHSQEKRGKVDEHGHSQGEEEDDGIIKLSIESQKLGSIEVMPVESEPLARKILVNGRVAQDVETVKHVHPVQSGRITESFVSLGQIVTKGTRLCIISAQNSNEVMEVTAPVSGTIIAEFVRPGDHVDSADALYTIADMTRIPANFDVYEKDLAHIKLGQKMKAYPISYPDRSFPAEIVFISPRVDESTYTTRIKSFVDNPVGLLKLGMSVRGEIEVMDDAFYLKVPADAVQNLQGKSIIFVQTDEETFEKREVDVKSKTSKEAAIAGALKKGEKVVVKGAFILKSKFLESEMEHAHDH
jgi:multidrug efflux pump subunit AcrA (membrane-fusion protein)